MENCKKRGQSFKRLDKHLSRAHPDITEREHSRLPKVGATQPSYMRYRVKEKCGLCGKTLLLLPHLKSTHKIKTWEQYISMLKKQGKGIPRKEVKEKKKIPSGGLYSLLKEISTVASESGKRVGKGRVYENELVESHEASKKRMAKRLGKGQVNEDEPEGTDEASNGSRSCIQDSEDEPVDADEASNGSPSCSQEMVQTLPYTEEDFLRFCVHNTNLYSVLATNHAIKEGKKDPATVLNTLSKNKMPIEYCRILIKKDLLQKLYGYYRFSEYYPYAKEKCLFGCTESKKSRYRFAEYYPSTESNSKRKSSCGCGLLPRSFYSFCKRACQALLNCTICKNWGNGYHACPDFFECDVCSDSARRWPLKIKHI